MIDSGMTAWMLISASLVLLMTPGLAFFYGGMVRGKSVLNMLMMSFGAMGVIGILYVLYGWSMSYADQSIGGIFGNPFEQWALNGVFTHGADGFEFAVSDGLPVIVDVGFQVTFAMITTALISGAIADRVKYGSWLVFSGLWVTLSYFPWHTWFGDVGSCQTTDHSHRSHRPSTSQVAQLCTSTPVSQHLFWFSSSASARASEPKRCGPTTSPS